MVELFHGPPGAQAIKDLGLYGVAASDSDVWGAVADSALWGNISWKAGRALLTPDVAPVANEYWRGYRAPRGHEVSPETEEISGPREDGPRVLSAQEATEAYGIKGVLSFPVPIGEASARRLRDDKYQELLRQDIIERRKPGITTGFAARGLIGLAMSLLDPLNLAAALVPGFGEARIAARLGWDLGSSLGARVGARAISGATAGAAGTAILEPLHWAVDMAEINDWTMGEAMRHVAYGAIIGSVLHTGIQGIIGRGAETRAMALRGAVAQVAEQRPVAVANAIDFAEATAARGKLEMFARRQNQLDDALAGASTEARLPGKLPPNTNLRERLAQLSREAESLRAEISVARTDAIRAALDPNTAERVALVEAELATVIPRTRRADLEHELNMLLEGRRNIDVSAGGIEASRAEVQARGLEIHLDRVKAEEGSVAKLLTGVEARDAAAQAAERAMRSEAEARLSSVDLLHIGQSKILLDRSARTVERYSRELGVALDQGEARAIAREILTAQPEEVQDILDRALREIAGRSPLRDIRPVADTTLPDALAQREAAAGEAMQQDARRALDPPDDIRAATEAAPKIEGVAERDLAEMQRVTAEMERAAEAEVKAGRVPEAERADLTAAREAVRVADQDANGYDAAAACIVSRII